MSAQDDIERLRSRAAHYRCEAALARDRAQVFYYRAFAADLEDTAIDLERLVGRHAPALAKADP